MGMLIGYKTYVVAAVAIIGAWAAWFTGDATMEAAIKMSIEAILAITIRHGIATTAEKG